METKKISIGWALITSDEDYIRDRAIEDGIDADSPEFWEGINASIDRFERKYGNIVGRYASNVCDFEHDSSDDLVLTSSLRHPKLI